MSTQVVVIHKVSSATAFPLPEKTRSLTIMHDLHFRLDRVRDRIEFTFIAGALATAAAWGIVQIAFRALN